MRCNYATAQAAIRSAQDTNNHLYNAMALLPASYLRSKSRCMTQDFTPVFDLRSDTVTRPTKGMLNAMMNAETGDDVFGEDPTVNRLQEELATMFGHESALFCPSGTMTNQIALNVHSRPGDEVICDKLAHIYNYEGGGMARNSGLSARLVEGNRGRFTAKAVDASVNPPDSHYARTRLVAVEDTVNKGGGAVWDWQQLKDVASATRRHGLGFHLDGARVFNALAESRVNTQEYGKLFDSISVCLSKGLGTPAGSVLIGSKEFIAEAHRVRKSMGGGMRQVGILAAAGIYALQHHLPEIKEDHQRARRLGAALEELDWVADILPVESNIVIFQTEGEDTAARYCTQLAQLGISAMPFGPGHIRFVLHREITDEMVEQIIQQLDRAKLS